MKIIIKKFFTQQREILQTSQTLVCLNYSFDITKSTWHTRMEHVEITNLHFSQRGTTTSGDKQQTSKWNTLHKFKWILWGTCLGF